MTMTNADLASELRVCETRAQQYEAAIRHARAVLTLHFHFTAFDPPITKEGRLDEPDAARLVIELLADHLKQLDGPDELELSGKLGILAHDLKTDGGARV